MIVLLQHIRDITDPEHPYSLEQLNVVEEDLITVDDGTGHVRYASCSFRLRHKRGLALHVPCLLVYTGHGSMLMFKKPVTEYQPC